MHVMSVPKFERLFRVAAGLDVDKADLKRYGDFVNRKIHDLLIRAQAAAKANGRDIIAPLDLPITRGLQESIHEFRKLDATQTRGSRPLPRQVRACSAIQASISLCSQRTLAPPSKVIRAGKRPSFSSWLSRCRV